jgi:hypothetical protein
MELIKMLQKSSETLVNIADRCLLARKFGVGGNLRGLQLSNLIIHHLHIIIKSLYVPLHLPFKMFYDAPGTWRLLQAMILLLGACHGEKKQGQYERSSKSPTANRATASRSLSTYCTSSSQPVAQALSNSYLTARRERQLTSPQPWNEVYRYCSNKTCIVVVEYVEL